MSGQASDANQELQAQVEFLQNLVFRLSHEVSRTTALSSPSSAALAKEETKRILEQLPEDLEVPEWLTTWHPLRWHLATVPRSEIDDRDRNKAL